MAVVEELGQQVGVRRACEALGVPRSSLYRSRQPRPEPVPRPTPPHALSSQERAAIRSVLNSDRFMDLPPRQVFATLLDEGTYLCSVSSMYRILRAHGEVHERRDVRTHPVYTKPELLATGPNQVWSWDITAMRGPVTWCTYRLYTVLDIYSRYVVAWLIDERETSVLASHLIAEATRKQGIQPDQLTLHADNGSPMTGKPLQDLLRDLNIVPSHSRPHTSDDNPFSEAQFKTMKYRPDYPKRFASIDDARTWARRFFDWYNNDHYHSGLNLLTPASVHYGQAPTVQSARQSVMSAAYAAHPERFTQGHPVVRGAPAAVYINPPQEVRYLA
jgi:putative transposase